MPTTATLLVVCEDCMRVGRLCQYAHAQWCVGKNPYFADVEEGLPQELITLDSMADRPQKSTQPKSAEIFWVVSQFRFLLGGNLCVFW